MNIWEFIRQPISKRIGNIPSAKGWFWDTGKVSDNYDMGTTSADFERAYKDEVWVQRCINLIASCVASVPIKLYKFEGDKKTEIKDHPILRLLDDVNPLTMNASDLWMATVINRKVYGNAYWYIERKGGAEPKELYSLRPPNIEIVPEIGVGKYIKTFDYTTGNPDVPKIQYNPHDIIHFKHFNPESEYYGLSPLASVREAISADLYAQAWNKNFFKNAGRPDGFFTNKEYLTEDQKKLMQKAIDATYKGVSKVGKVGILEGGWEYKQVSVVPKDAEWEQLRAACREAICSALGVPPVLVVAFMAATYATAIEQKKSFWHETCIPELHYYAEVMNWNLLPQFKNTQGMKLEFDLTNVPALLDETSQIYDRLFRATGVPFLTVNEARNFLAMSEVDGGDAMYIPLNMIEAGGSEEG